MPKYEDIVEVDRLKNLAENLGWKVGIETYSSDSVTVTLFKKLFEPVPEKEG